MRHLDLLDQRFGAARCSAAVRDLGHARSGWPGAASGAPHTLSFGERDGSRSPRIQAIAGRSRARSSRRALSDDPAGDVGEVGVHRDRAGITCLMRATIGDIVAADAADLRPHCSTNAPRSPAGEGFPPRAAPLERAAPC